MKRSHAQLVTGLTLIAGLTAMIAQARAHRHPPARNEAACSGSEVMTFRRNLATAIAAKDQPRLRRMYSSAFIQTHGTGKQDGRDARIASVLSGDPVIETLPADMLSIRIHDDDGCAAVATGQSTRTMADRTVQVLAWTAVYLRNDDKWKLVASHVTRLSETKP